MSEYPERLLPKNCYCSKIETTRLLGKNLYLQRKCFLPESQCCVDGDRNNVTPAAFGDTGLSRMSVNLIGGLFLIGDEKWYQNVTENDNWKEGDIDIKLYEGKYEIQDISTSIYFKLDIANSLHWQFPRFFNDNCQYVKYKDAIIKGMSDNFTFSKAVQYQLKVHSECHHSPHCLNYWHMEVRSIIDSIPPEEIKGKNKREKEALRGMIEVLRKHSSLNPPSLINIISEDVYIKNS